MASRSTHNVVLLDTLRTISTRCDFSSLTSVSKINFCHYVIVLFEFLLSEGNDTAHKLHHVIHVHGCMVWRCPTKSLPNCFAYCSIPAVVRFDAGRQISLFNSNSSLHRCWILELCSSPGPGIWRLWPQTVLTFPDQLVIDTWVIWMFDRRRIKTRESPYIGCYVFELWNVELSIESLLLVDNVLTAKFRDQ